LPGSDLVDAIAIRIVQHHNKNHFISLPIAIGVSKRFRSFEVGLNTGIALNYFIQQNGKPINASEEIINYSNNDRTLPYSDFFVSYQVQPFINYSTSKSLSIQLQPDFRYQNHGQSTLWDLDHTSILWGMRVGVIYSY